MEPKTNFTTSSQKYAKMWIIFAENNPAVWTDLIILRYTVWLISK